jgi:tRNA G18 (ribose-2'-O)-methylase SpoU
MSTELVRIDRLDDPRLAEYRAVGDPALARSRGLFVAEGRMVVRRVLEDPRYRLHSMLLNDTAHRELAALVDEADRSFPIYVCTTRDFESVTGFNIHRGCLALVHRPTPIAVEELIATSQRLVLLDGVADADNVGGIFRNAAAFGVDGVLLTAESGDPLYRKAVRTSMGAVLRVPFAHSRDWPGDLARVRAAGFVLVALTPREPSEPLDAVVARVAGSRFALVVGSEGSGISATVESAADVRARIPIADRVDSLNVAVASGIALHRLLCHG